MVRIILDGEMVNLGSSQLSVKKALWSNSTSRAKGRTADAIALNASLDALTASLYELFRKHEFEDYLTAESFKTLFLGEEKEFSTILPVFDKYIESIKEKVGVSLRKGSFQKYTIIRRDFVEFLETKYKRKDLGLLEFNSVVLKDFELFLVTEKNISHNTAQKKLKGIKTMVIYAQKRGIIQHDPFMDIRFHYKPVDRGFLTEEEVIKISDKDLSSLPRLELVRDIFLFSCFTGLAYIDVSNLTPEHIVSLDGNDWIMTKRQKTSTTSNVLLLDIPKSIIQKYEGQTKRKGKLFPILSNQKMNSYLKEIADICGIKKNLTFHIARHTFATLCLSKGVPVESVSKILGHTNIKTTQIYARITNKKIEKDMMELADKIGDFSLNNVPPLEAATR